MKIPELNKQQLAFIGVAAAVIGIIIVLLAVYWGKIKAHIESNRLARAYDDEIRKTDLTLSELQAKGIADKLFVAMDGPGTDTQALYSAFQQIQTYSDLMLVMKQFGTQKGTYDWFGGAQSLIEWIADDCSKREIEKINAILAGKGINYVF